MSRNPHDAAGSVLHHMLTNSLGAKVFMKQVLVELCMNHRIFIISSFREGFRCTVEIVTGAVKQRFRAEKTSMRSYINSSTLRST